MNAPLVLQVPIELPSPEAVAEIIYRAAADCARAQLVWLSYKEAAKHCGWCRKTFERKRRKFGMPYADLDGSKRVLREDVDALLLAHVTAPGTTVINFPSLGLREAARERVERWKGAA